MRGIVVLAAMLATPACDLVFPPSHLDTDGGAAIDAKESADGRTGTPDGDPDAPAPPIDSPPGTPDAGVADADTSCLLACLGNNGIDGVTGCAPSATQWCGSAQLDPLAPFALCNCTNGNPSLIAFDVTGTTVDLAFLPAAASSYFVRVDFDVSSCIAATFDCQIDNICAGPPAQLVYFDDVPVSGGATTFELYFDPGCSVTMAGIFYWQP